MCPTDLHRQPHIAIIIIDVEAITSSQVTMITPTSLSYYMPPEWEKHRACLILYPHNSGVFRSDTDVDNSGTNTSGNKRCKKEIICGPARTEVRNVARAICNCGEEDVFIFCNTEEDAEDLRIKFKEEEEQDEKEVSSNGKGHDGKKNHIHVKVCASDDSWCRDTGPTFVKKMNVTPTDRNDTTSQNNLTGLDWNFNAYGGPEEGCYWPCRDDQEVAKKIIDILSNHYNNIDENDSKLRIEREAVEMVLEGGSFHTDGEGTILTTEECLLNSNRNPTMTREEIEQNICHYLGASKVIWLPHGVFNDKDTNGHVDNIATFAKPGEVVLAWTNDINDENYQRCKAAEAVLLNQVDAKGRSIVVHKLHLPRALYYTSEEVSTLGGNDIVDDSVDACKREIGNRLAASYVNYYLANEAIILPQFGDPVFDKRAAETMHSIFPSKKIACIFSREILLGGGNIHCITQQFPSL